MSIVHVNNDNFDSDVLQSGTPVLVDFWAEWCGPCKMIAPILEQAADEYADRLQIMHGVVRVKRNAILRNASSIFSFLYFNLLHGIL